MHFVVNFIVSQTKHAPFHNVYADPCPPVPSFCKAIQILKTRAYIQPQLVPRLSKMSRAQRSSGARILPELIFKMNA